MVYQLFVLKLSKIAEKGKSAVLFPGKSLPNNGRAASPYVDVFPEVTRGMDDPKKILPRGYSPWLYFPILPKLPSKGLKWFPSTRDVRIRIIFFSDEKSGSQLRTTSKV